MEKEKCMLTTVRRIKLSHLHHHLHRHLLAVKEDGYLNFMAQALEQPLGDHLADVIPNHPLKSLTIQHSPEDAGEEDTKIFKDCFKPAKNIPDE